MISVEMYYKILYEKLINKSNNMFVECETQKLSDVKIVNNIFEDLYALLDRVEDKYEFDMQKTLLPNYKKFVLWQNFFIGWTDIKRILIATKFVIFCCLVDKFLDSGRFSIDAKKEVCKKIHLYNFTTADEYKSSEFTELDILLNDIRLYILNTSCTSNEKDILLNAIDRALTSEEYMYRNPLVTEDKICEHEIHFLIDKSIEFEKAAFMLSIYSDNTEVSKKAAVNVGKIFWLIDDLCDVPEDIEYRRKNSILFLEMKLEKMSIGDRIKNAIENMDIFLDELMTNLEELRILAGDDFYEYIINDVWEWCLGIRNIVNK